MLSLEQGQTAKVEVPTPRGVPFRVQVQFHGFGWDNIRYRFLRSIGMQRSLDHMRYLLRKGLMPQDFFAL